MTFPQGFPQIVSRLFFYFQVVIRVFHISAGYYYYRYKYVFSLKRDRLRVNILRRVWGDADGF